MGRVGVLCVLVILGFQLVLADECAVCRAARAELLDRSVEESKKWVAGFDIDTAIETARALNERGIFVVLNKLGEHYGPKDVARINADVHDYIELLDRIDKEGLNASISIKPTQIGLEFSERMCRYNFLRIVDRADDLNLRVCLDMEGSQFHEETLRVYYAALASTKNKRVRLAIKCNRKDSLAETQKLTALGGSARIVRGAYANEEGDGVHFDSMDEVYENLVNVAEATFPDSRSALATTNMKYVEMFLGRGMEFQTLFGYAEELKQFLLERGEHISEYVPFGDNWLEYCTRRDPFFLELKEKTCDAECAGARDVKDELQARVSWHLAPNVTVTSE